MLYFGQWKKFELKTSLFELEVPTILSYTLITVYPDDDDKGLTEKSLHSREHNSIEYKSLCLFYTSCYVLETFINDLRYKAEKLLYKVPGLLLHHTFTWKLKFKLK